MTVLLLVPTALGAEEVQFGVRTGVSWTDNVFGDSEDERAPGRDEEPVSDFSGRISPSVALKDPDGELNWSLRYQPSYEAYLDQSEIDGFDHSVVGVVSWQFTERWKLSLEENYAIYQSSVRFNEAAGPGEEVAQGFRDQEVRSNRTSAELAHTLSPRSSLSLGLNYDTFQYPDEGGTDRSVPSLEFAYRNLLSERTTVGARLSWIQQTYDRPTGGDDETYFYNLAGTLEHRFSPTFRVEAAAGPTFVDSTPPEESSFQSLQFPLAGRVNVGGVLRGPFVFDADLCEVDGVPRRARRFVDDCALPIVTNPTPPPPFDFPTEITPDEFFTLAGNVAEVPTVDANGNLVDPSDFGGTDLTYFARLALHKTWETWNGSLIYQRSNSESARFGSSSVADTLSVSLGWSPRPLWSFRIGASASLQEQVADQTVPIGFQLENVPAPAGVTSVPTVAQVQALIVSEDGSELKYRTQSASFTATRRLTRQSSAFATVYWNRQEQDGLLGAEAVEWNNLVLWVGLDWQFDPIRF